MKKSRRRSRPGLKSSQKIFFPGGKVVATKLGEVYWVIRGLHWKINIFFVTSCFFLTQVDKLLNAPRICVVFTIHACLWAIQSWRMMPLVSKNCISISFTNKVAVQNFFSGGKLLHFRKLGGSFGSKLLNLIQDKSQVILGHKKLVLLVTVCFILPADVFTFVSCYCWGNVELTGFTIGICLISPMEWVQPFPLTRVKLRDVLHNISLESFRHSWLSLPILMSVMTVV